MGSVRMLFVINLGLREGIEPGKRDGPCCKGAILVFFFFFFFFWGGRAPRPGHWRNIELPSETAPGLLMCSRLTKK